MEVMDREAIASAVASTKYITDFQYTGRAL